MLNREILLAELIKIEPNIGKNWPKYEDSAKESGLSIVDYLQGYGNFDEELLKNAVAKAFGVEPIENLAENLGPMTLRYIPLPMAKTQKIVIFDESSDAIKMATSNPAQEDILNPIARKIQKPLKIYFAFSYEIDKSLKAPQENVEAKFANLKAGALKDITNIESLKNSSKLLDAIIINSLQRKASDIHIEPHEGRLLIRYRVDGVLEDIITLPIEIAEIIVSRIKVLAELRTDEHFKPQDGRFRLELSDKSIVTTRVSIIPVYDGEKIVMRILQAKEQKTDLVDLGFTLENQEKIYNNINKTHGMLLVTGPTGSGKTTTLYTLLKLLNKPEVNLMTIEDPIEYKMDRVNQIQVNPAAGIDFANGLRSILRQDPNVIMVGEIRDAETASIAINAALTGHLVLATLHTNSAIGSIPRLLDMGVEPYLIATTVNIINAQRLVRKLCDKCKKPIKFEKKMIQVNENEKSEFSTQIEKYADLYLPEGTQIYEAGKCDECGQTGYSGRLCIAEVFDITDEIKEMIFTKKSPVEIEASARSHGFKNMIEDGFIKIKEGSTTIEEVIRVTKE